MALRDWFRKSPPPAAPTVNQLEQLKAGVSEARTLLEFAVSSRRKVEDKVIDELMKSIDGLGKLDGQAPVSLTAEAAFWRAYQQLAEATTPVTAVSIMESRAASRKRLGTTGGHSLGAIVIFFLLALLQIMWVFGATLRNNLSAIDKEIAVKEQENRPRYDALRSLTLEEERIRGDEKKKPTAAEDVDLKRIVLEKSKIQSALQESTQALMKLRADREPLLSLIGKWYKAITRGIWPPGKELETGEEEKRLAENRTKLNALGAGTAEAVKLRTDMLRLERTIATKKDQHAKELSWRVDLLIDALQKYIIPLVLGLLGAFTYILRTLIAQIREHSYTESTSSMSVVRICLGMIAGLLGGMIMNPGSEEVLKALPPLAMPFLFGYAVEVVFAFLDRIVRAFVDEPGRKPS